MTRLWLGSWSGSVSLIRRRRLEGVGARRWGQDLGDAPVHHVDLTVVADHDVVGLEVAVADAAAVRERDRVEDLEEHVEQPEQVLVLDRRGDQEPALVDAIVGRAERDDQVVEGAALDQLHAEVGLLVLVERELVDRDDVGVVELAGDLGLADEAADRQGRVLVDAVQRLDRDPSAQRRVDGDVDGRHAAARELTLVDEALALAREHRGDQARGALEAAVVRDVVVVAHVRAFVASARRLWVATQAGVWSADDPGRSRGRQAAARRAGVVLGAGRARLPAHPRPRPAR